jgi:ribosomal protein S18 acetylase RimI-like enzyme
MMSPEHGPVPALAKKLARLFFGDYAAYRIYASPASTAASSLASPCPAFRVASVDRLALQASLDPLMREQSGYAGSGAQAYACFDGERIVGACFYWFGERYRQRNFWPLAQDEAKLVQIIVLPEMRGHGIASMLVAASWNDMTERGFCRGWARVWHSNTPSSCAFERADWRRVALVIEINPLRLSRSIRVCLPARVSR